MIQSLKQLEKISIYINELHLLNTVLLVPIY